MKMKGEGGAVVEEEQCERLRGMKAKGWMFVKDYLETAQIIIFVMIGNYSYLCLLRVD